MMETSARLLRLLSLLQSRREWPGPELAATLGVSARTVRTDVDRLRSLGYEVRAAPGVGGGYRLRSGTAVPPLFLDPDEAVAVAVGLRTATQANVAGVGEQAVQALSKLEQVLPGPVRQQVRAVQSAVLTAAEPAVDPIDVDILRTLTAACRDDREVRLTYRDRDGRTGDRVVEPLRLVLSGQRWYLLAWDVQRAGWRTFRADRMAGAVPGTRRFVPRRPPAEDIAGYVAARTGSAMWQCRATLRVRAGAAEISRRVPPAVMVEPDGDGSCVVRVGSDSWELLSLYIGMLGADFVVLDPPELVTHLAELAGRYERAVAGSTGSTDS